MIIYNVEHVSVRGVMALVVWEFARRSGHLTQYIPPGSNAFILSKHTSQCLVLVETLNRGSEGLHGISISFPI